MPCGTDGAVTRNENLSLFCMRYYYYEWEMKMNQAHKITQHQTHCKLFNGFYAVVYVFACFPLPYCEIIFMLNMSEYMISSVCIVLRNGILCAYD